jgi:hypothetical protein
MDRNVNLTLFSGTPHPSLLKKRKNESLAKVGTTSAKHTPHFPDTLDVTVYRIRDTLNKIRQKLRWDEFFRKTRKYPFGLSRSKQIVEKFILSSFICAREPWQIEKDNAIPSSGFVTIKIWRAHCQTKWWSICDVQLFHL